MAIGGGNCAMWAVCSSVIGRGPLTTAGPIGLKRPIVPKINLGLSGIAPWRQRGIPAAVGRRRARDSVGYLLLFALTICPGSASARRSGQDSQAHSEQPHPTPRGYDPPTSAARSGRAALAPH